MVLPAKTLFMGNPPSSTHQPSQVEAARWGHYLEQLVEAGGLAAAEFFETKAALDADLAHADGARAVVYGDGAQNGIYLKSGASGSGAWSRILDYLPGYQFVSATDAGAGTANAIIATASPAVSYADGAQLITVNIHTTNTTDAVTIAFDGGAALAVKTASGSDPGAGSLVSGMQMVGVVASSASEFQLLSDVSSAAAQAAAEAARDEAEQWASLARSVFPMPDFNIAQTDQVDAINAALADGGKVTVPPGEWMIGSAMRLPSNSALINNGKIRLMDGVYDNILINENARALLFPASVAAFTGSSLADPDGTIYAIEARSDLGGDGFTYRYKKVAAPSDENDQSTWITPLRTAAGVWVVPAANENIHVHGAPGSILDGNAANQDQLGSAWADVGAHRVKGMILSRVNRWSFCGNILINTANWAMSHEGCSNFIVADNTILQKQNAVNDENDPLTFSNQDGIDVRQGCSNFSIRDNFIVSKDDSIACTTLKSRNDPAVYGTWAADPGFEGVEDANPDYNPSGQINYRWALDVGYDIRNFDISRNITIARGSHHGVRLTADSGRQISDFTIKGIRDYVTRDDITDEAFAEYSGRNQIDAVVLVGDSDYWYGDDYTDVEGAPSIDPDDIRNGRIIDCGGFANNIVRFNAPSRDIRMENIYTGIHADAVGYLEGSDTDPRQDQRLVGYYHDKGNNGLGGAYTGTVIKYLGHKLINSEMAHDLPTTGGYGASGEILYTGISGPIELELTVESVGVKHCHRLAFLSPQLQDSKIRFKDIGLRKGGGIGDTAFNVHSDFDWGSNEVWCEGDFRDNTDRNFNVVAGGPDLGKFYETDYGMLFSKGWPEVQSVDDIPNAAGGSELRFAAGVLGTSAAVATRRSGQWDVQETSRGILEANLRVSYDAAASSANAIKLNSTAGLANSGISTVPNGLEIRFRSGLTNTGGVGIDLDDTGPVACRTPTGAVLPAGYIRTDRDHVARYDGSNWIVYREVEVIAASGGTAVKFEDGRMILNNPIIASVDCNDGTLASGAGYADYTWTFGVTFSDPAVVLCHGDASTRDVAVIGGDRTTTVDLRHYRVDGGGTSATGTDISGEVTGFWYAP